MENINLRQKMINRSLILSIIISIGISSHCQIPKKTLMLGGEFNIGFQSPGNGLFDINLFPSIGYFLQDNLAIGLMLESSYHHQSDLWLAGVGFGPLIRYYFGKDKLQYFGHLSWIGSFTYINRTKDTNFYSVLTPGIGINYMLLPSVGVEGLLGYIIQHKSVNDMLSNNSVLSFKLGFQIFIPQKIITKTN